MSVAEEIDIPDAAIAVKSWFPNQPSDNIVREIKKFIGDGNPPHLWRGHTHTKPPNNALPVYLDEIDIPGAKKSHARWATCPCCSPRHRKWFSRGKIAWFPEEGVVRIIGPDCFASLNAEGHSEALDALRLEQRRKRDIQYLLRHLGIVPEAVQVLRAAIAVATEIDEFRRQLHKRLGVFMRTPLWNHVRDGVLSIRIVRTETKRSPDGQEFTAEVQDQVAYARIAGYELLDPRLPSFKARIQNYLTRLEEINYGSDPETAIGMMADGERHRVAGQLGSSIRTAQAVLDQMEGVRRFFSAETMATLRRWGAHRDAPVRMYIMRQNGSFYIGETQVEQMRIELDPAIDMVLPTLPRLADVDV